MPDLLEISPARVSNDGYATRKGFQYHPWGVFCVIAHANQRMCIAKKRTGSDISRWKALHPVRRFAAPFFHRWCPPEKAASQFWNSRLGGLENFQDSCRPFRWVVAANGSHDEVSAVVFPWLERKELRLECRRNPVQFIDTISGVQRSKYVSLKHGLAHHGGRWHNSESRIFMLHNEGVTWNVNESAPAFLHLRPGSDGTLGLEVNNGAVSHPFRQFAIEKWWLKHRT